MEPCIRSLGGTTINIISPKDLFLQCHNLDGGYQDSLKFWYHNACSDLFVWDPSLATVDAYLEELQKARMKRQQIMHIIIIPSLMNHL